MNKHLNLKNGCQNGSAMKLSFDKACRLEAWEIFKKPAVGLTSTFGALTGIVSAYELASSQLLLDDEFFSYALLVLLATWLLLLVIALIASFFQANRKEMIQDIRMNVHGSIEVIEGHYVSTLEILIERMQAESESLDGLYCVMGISTKSNLNYISEGSVLESVLKKYIELYKIKEPYWSNEQITEHFQMKINQALLDDPISKVTETCKVNTDHHLSFAFCYVVDFDAIEDASGCCPKIIFVVNSSFRSSDDRSDIEGPESIDVIPAIFQKTMELNITHLLVPALGTYRLGNSTQSVISGIIIRYLAAIMRKASRPYNMTITLRKSDLDRSGIRLSQIKHYIREATRLYN